METLGGELDEPYHHCSDVGRKNPKGVQQSYCVEQTQMRVQGGETC